MDSQNTHYYSVEEQHDWCNPTAIIFQTHKGASGYFDIVVERFKNIGTVTVGDERAHLVQIHPNGYVMFYVVRLTKKTFGETRIVPAEPFNENNILRPETAIAKFLKTGLISNPP